MTETQPDSRLILEAVRADIGLRPSGSGEDSGLREAEVSTRLGSWLRVRLFESVIAEEGLSRYLHGLVTYTGNEPEKDVKLNAQLAATHISTAISAVIWDTVLALKKSGKIRLQENQIKALENVLNPPRQFRLTKTFDEVEFDPLEVEDVRSEIQRAVFDQLDSSTRTRDKPMRSARVDADSGLLPTGAVPTDLETIGSVEGMDLQKAIDVSRKYDSLRIGLVKGYLVWKFASKPTLFVKEGNVFFSRKLSGGTLEEGKIQLGVISNLLASGAVTCVLCKRHAGSELAYLRSGEVRLVCSECEHDPKVLRLILSLTPSQG
jgi:hypothetical protein